VHIFTTIRLFTNLNAVYWIKVNIILCNYITSKRSYDLFV